MTTRHAAHRRRHILAALGTSLRMATQATAAAEAVIAAAVEAVRPDRAVLVTADGLRILAHYGAASISVADQWRIALHSRGQSIAWLLVGHAGLRSRQRQLLDAIAAVAAPTLDALILGEQHDIAALNAAFGQASSIEQLSSRIFAALGDICDARNSYLAVLDESGQLMAPLALQIDGTPLTLDLYWTLHAGLSSVVVRSGAPIVTDDYAATCRAYGVTALPLGSIIAVQGWLGVPLRARGQVFGALVLLSAAPHAPFDASHVGRVAAIADGAAGALDSLLQHRRIERLGREMAAVHQIGRAVTSSLERDQVTRVILELATELLNVDECSLLLADHTGTMIYHEATGPLGRQLLGRAVPNGSLLRSQALRAGQSVGLTRLRFDGWPQPATRITAVQSTLATPLRGVDAILGAIEVGMRRDGAPFSHADRRLLEVIADYAVIALENAQRFAQIDRALARRVQELAQTNDHLRTTVRGLIGLNALNGVARAPATTADDMLRAALEIFTELGGCLGGGVLQLAGAQSGLIARTGRGSALDASICAGLATACLMRGSRLETHDAGVAGLHDAGLRLLVVPCHGRGGVLAVLLLIIHASSLDATWRELAMLFAASAATLAESAGLVQQLRLTSERTTSILATMSEGILLLDSQLAVVLANPALARLVRNDATLDGQPLAALMAHWCGHAGAIVGLDGMLAEVQRLVGGAGLDVAAGELDLRDARRHLVWEATRIVPGVPGAVLLLFRDVSEAHEAARLRDDLTHLLLHDLRNPLANVMLALRLLSHDHGQQCDHDQVRLLNIARDGAEQLLQMTNTLLDINRLEEGQVPLRRQVVDLGALVQQAIERVAPLAADRQIRVERDVLPTLPIVRLDRDLMLRVVQNLLINALRYSPRQTVVRVEVSADAALVRIAVHDQGIGIAAHHHDAIFRKYTQIGEHRGGSGLGLYLSKLVVDAHGGTIGVISAAGRGSTFVVTLPC